jgi:hypothetical protein
VQLLRDWEVVPVSSQTLLNVASVVTQIYAIKLCIPQSNKQDSSSYYMVRDVLCTILMQYHRGVDNIASEKGGQVCGLRETVIAPKSAMDKMRQDEKMPHLSRATILSRVLLYP